MLRSNFTGMRFQPGEEIPGLTRPLTPEECRRTAESFKDLPPEFQLSAEEMEMLQEETHGKPMQYSSTQEAIAAMQRRLARLMEQKATALDHATGEEHDPAMEAVDSLNRDIARTKAFLEHYRFQQGTAN